MNGNRHYFPQIEVNHENKYSEDRKLLTLSVSVKQAVILGTWGPRIKISLEILVQHLSEWSQWLGAWGVEAPKGGALCLVPSPGHRSPSWEPCRDAHGHRTRASHLGLGLVSVLVVEELVPTQHEPALLPALPDAPLLLQPACLQHRAQAVGAGRPPWAPALLPHHQAFGAGWKPRTHMVSVKDARHSLPHPGIPAALCQGTDA